MKVALNAFQVEKRFRAVRASSRNMRSTNKAVRPIFMYKNALAIRVSSQSNWCDARRR
jgi:hypothetical protein